MPQLTASASVVLRRYRMVGTAMVSLLGLLPWHATAVESTGDVPVQSLSVEALAVPPSARLATMADPHAPSLREPAAAGMHARWSWGNRQIGLGASADWASRANASALRSMWGVHADLAPTTRVIYEVRAGAAAADNGLLSDPATQSRWTLEVKSSPSPLRQLQSGLLRLQMSSTSTLALRPRGGGMTVSWQSRF